MIATVVPGVGLDLARGVLAHLLQPLEVRTRIELRIFNARDQERRGGQISQRLDRRIEPLGGEHSGDR